MSDESKWSAHVSAWRASGLGAAAFCAGKGITASGLRYWAGRFKDAPAAPAEIRLARVVRPGAATEPEEPVLIEAGGIRIAVRSGFDRGVLRDVLIILRESAS